MEVAKRKSQRLRGVTPLSVQPDKIIRSERKTLSVSIDALGVVTVRAPVSCTTARIFAFLEEKETWILRKKAERVGAGAKLPSENLDGFSFLLLGENYRIRLVDGKRISLSGKEILLPNVNAQKRLVKWLKENAKRIFALETERVSRKAGISYSSVSVSSARTRWGSCSGKNAIRYSFRLLYAPKDVIEYVVVHELAHVKYKNHSKLFWREVERLCPDYKNRRKWLKQNAFLMKIL